MATTFSTQDGSFVSGTRPLTSSGTTEQNTSDRMSEAIPDDQRPLTDQLEQIVETWAKSQYELVMLAAEFADSPECG